MSNNSRKTGDCHSSAISGKESDKKSNQEQVNADTSISEFKPQEENEDSREEKETLSLSEQSISISRITPKAQLRESAVINNQDIEDDQPQTQFQMIDLRESQNPVPNQNQRVLNREIQRSSLIQSQDSALPFSQSDSDKNSQAIDSSISEPQEEDFNQVQQPQQNSNDQQLQVSQQSAEQNKQVQQNQEDRINHHPQNFKFAQLAHQQIPLPHRILLSLFIFLLIFSYFSIRVYQNLLLSNQTLSVLSTKQSESQDQLTDLTLEILSQSEARNDIDVQMQGMRDLLKNQTVVIQELYLEIRKLRLKVRQRRSTMERILRYIGLYSYIDPEDDDDDDEYNSEYKSDETNKQSVNRTESINDEYDDIKIPYVDLDDDLGVSDLFID